MYVLLGVVSTASVARYICAGLCGATPGVARCACAGLCGAISFCCQLAKCRLV